ncbi:Ca2+:H+ antiporter [Rhizobium subbaraonis]|uniref:Ca2+:H+ antiporter n=1 Tax=Rhizobium subbaraonis TaxID=908946 RepID=A0A285UM85_9HYPH|nr:calcium:proton antiporter [Rhizobium subbaraonis]SOC43015.1 Ca2+:H+ antiporter [Rhizobium subbaraonis]
MQHDTKPQKSTLALFAREERLLPVSLFAAAAFYAYGDTFAACLSHPVGLALVFAALFAIILGSVLSVVRHADELADRLGEPFGTLILTLTITTIEVVAISAVMFHGDNNSTLVRDTLFAVIMIILNGMVGLSLLLGAWRRPEQRHNLQGANAYLGLIVPLATLSLVLPEFQPAAYGPAISSLHQTVLVFMSIVLYGTFLLLQTGRHRVYFTQRNSREDHGPQHAPSAYPLLVHVMLLFAYMAPVVYLVDHLAKPIDYLVETIRAPAALGGVIMAVLVATPEAISAVRAAIADRLQRAVNIFLGSVLSTIGLTVPVMLAISHLTGHTITLGLGRSEMVMLILTLAVSMITFASGRTNLMQGSVHLTLFITYLLLILEG